MKAKCPNCDYGCERCVGGFFEAPFSDGPIFTLDCVSDACGFANSAQILGPDLPPLKTDETKCMMCGALTAWDLYGWSAPDPSPLLDDDEPSE